MWVVQGKTVSGKNVEYKIQAGKDTEKAFVMAMAFQEHGKAEPEDDLTSEVAIVWTSDNVFTLPQRLTLMKRENFAVDKRIKKGVWERHSPRAFRTLESALDALESAASEYPNDQFRIVGNYTESEVISVSKNSLGSVNEEPDKPEDGKIEGQTEIEVKAPPASEGTTSKPEAPKSGSTTPKAKPAAKPTAPAA